MPPAIEAVVEGRMYGTVRNSSCRIRTFDEEYAGALDREVDGVARVAQGR